MGIISIKTVRLRCKKCNIKQNWRFEETECKFKSLHFARVNCDNDKADLKELASGFRFRGMKSS